MTNLEVFMNPSGLVAEPIVKARTRKRLAPSRISGPLVFFGRMIAPAYLRIALRFRRIEILNPEAVVRAMNDFQEKRTRLIVAFRHAYGDEAQLLFHVFENLVPRYARRLREPLKHKPGMRPIHDYAVALWGDAVVRFILPRVGALPVYHSKYDAASLGGIRSVMRDGPSPLGLAPEGQISYHAETLPRIEQGAIRMGFWCARDLDRAGRPERVRVLPLSVHYRYDLRDQKKVRRALAHIEALCGLDRQPASGADRTPEGLLQRIDRIESRLLKATEEYYETTYGYRPPDAPEADADGAEARHGRWMALLPFAIAVAEHILGIEPESGDTVQRMYRVRQAGWDRVYPESPVEGLDPLEAAFADRRTGEAWYAMRHMELVDVMGYHDAGYLDAARPDGPSFDRIVETVLTLVDLTYRLMGGNITNRPNNIRKKAVIVPGGLIDLTDRLPEYRLNARQTVQTLTEELMKKFTDCIEVFQHG
jgi:hypothetical protein